MIKWDGPYTGSNQGGDTYYMVNTDITSYIGEMPFITFYKDLDKWMLFTPKTKQKGHTWEYISNEEADYMLAHPEEIMMERML